MLSKICQKIKARTPNYGSDCMQVHESTCEYRSVDFADQNPWHIHSVLKRKLNIPHYTYNYLNEPILQRQNFVTNYRNNYFPLCDLGCHGRVRPLPYPPPPKKNLIVFEWAMICKIRKPLHPSTYSDVIDRNSVRFRFRHYLGCQFRPEFRFKCELKWTEIKATTFRQKKYENLTLNISHLITN